MVRDVMPKTRESKDIPRAELVYMVAQLRGVLYEFDDSKEVLEETRFDVSNSDDWSNKRVREPEFTLVTGSSLKHGDYLLLDDGAEVMVRGTDKEGCTKSALRIRFKGRPPMRVKRYWEPRFRRVIPRPKAGILNLCAHTSFVNHRNDQLPEDWKTHATHCCSVHGCKYESIFEDKSSCPVVTGLVEREKNVGWCQEPHLVDNPEECRKPGEKMPATQEELDQWDRDYEAEKH